MEKQEKINNTIRIFTFLINKTFDRSFTFPGGGIAKRHMAAFVSSIEDYSQRELSAEMMIDYCVCQVHVMSMYNKFLLSKWTVAHSFGPKAIERFTGNVKSKRYFEDKFLQEYNLSREMLSFEFRDKSVHPLHKFIYPDYEEVTKQRMYNSQVGFYICQLSTLLWTPFSCSCRSCKHSARCKSVTQQKYAELYRIRMEEYNKYY